MAKQLRFATTGATFNAYRSPCPDPVTPLMMSGEAILSCRASAVSLGTDTGPQSGDVSVTWMWVIQRRKVSSGADYASGRQSMHEDVMRALQGNTTALRIVQDIEP